MGPKSSWRNITLTLGGDLSSDLSSPGILHETFAPFNHSVGRKNPNMLFNITRDPQTGSITHMHFYACLGKVLPFGKDVFSYLLYVRDPDLTNSQLDELVQPDKHKGVFELDGLVYTNRTTWQTCEVLPHTTSVLV